VLRTLFYKIYEDAHTFVQTKLQAKMMLLEALYIRQCIDLLEGLNVGNSDPTSKYKNIFFTFEYLFTKHSSTCNINIINSKHFIKICLFLFSYLFSNILILINFVFFNILLVCVYKVFNNFYITEQIEKFYLIINLILKYILVKYFIEVVIFRNII